MFLEKNAPTASWKKQLPLYTLLCSNIISQIGSTLTGIAIPWFVLQTTGSVIKTGISAFFTALPSIIASLLGGVLVDKYGSKRVSIISDVAASIAISFIPSFYHTVGLSFSRLLVLAFLATLLTGPGVTARAALVPDLAKMAGMSFERVSAVTQGTSHVAILVGALLAGILISLLGTSNLLWIDACTFVFSAVLIGLGVPPLLQKEQHIQPETLIQEQQAAQPQFPKSSFVTEFQEGIHFILHDAMSFAILLTLVVTNLLDVSLIAVVLPAYVKQFFGDPLILGIINACFVGAALSGTLIYGAFGHRLHRYFALTLPLIFMSLRYWTLALAPSLVFIYIISVIAGFASSPLNPVIFAIAYERIPEYIRGRVMGAGFAMAALGIPLGVLLSGYLVSSIGMQWSLIAMGACYLLMALNMFINPSLDKLKSAS
jgi:MFS family permease